MLRHRCFTLIEVLVAAFAMAILIAALVIPVQGALRERERANDADADAFRVHRVLDRVRDDLDGLLIPGGDLTGQFVGTKNDTQDGRRDTFTFATSAAGFRAGLDSTGGCVRVEYELTESDTGTGYDWMRTETLNPLSEDEDASVESVMLAGVRTLELAFYDGTSWQESWDSSTDDGLPQAVKLTFTLEPDDTGEDIDTEDLPTYRLLIPVLIESADEESGAAGGQGE